MTQTGTRRVGAAIAALILILVSAYPLFPVDAGANPQPLAAEAGAMQTRPDLAATLTAASRTMTPRSPAPPTSQNAGELREQRFFSATLGRSMHYFIYLPAGYAGATRRYPTLYLLHGRNTLGADKGSDREWVMLGLPDAADHMMRTGAMQPTIIVLPQGDAGYWMNHANGGERWGDYTARDVVAHIDATYRTAPGSAYRGVGGLSMGGHGAMQLAINYPNVFGVVGMHSPTLRADAARPAFFGDAAHFASVDPASLVRRYPDRARTLAIWLDVGRGDEAWRDSAFGMRDLLTAQKVPHTFQSWAGDHGKDYWRAHCADYLRFYGTALAVP